MKARAEMLALRRQRLIAECHAQRTDLTLQMQPMIDSLGSAHVALRIAGRLVRHPEWIVATTVGVMLMKPHRLSALLQAGTGGLRSWRMIAPAVQMLLTRR
jgi:hypothetical protein